MNSPRFSSRLKISYLIAVIFSLALSVSCTDKSETEPDELFLKGMANYTAENFIAAAAFFDEAAIGILRQLSRHSGNDFGSIGRSIKSAYQKSPCAKGISILWK